VCVCVYFDRPALISSPHKGFVPNFPALRIVEAVSRSLPLFDPTYSLLMLGSD
jgi:hypothetical protein